jgi:CDP-6-deoxy-D-xylo-4-hexulose-3-dehydrase
MRVLYAEATLGQGERDAVNAVMDDPKRLVDGPRTAELEETVANLFEKSHGVFVNSGSSANYLAIEALDLPPGSEVITPATTFSTTVAPLVKNDLVPVFVDIDPATYQADPDEIQEAITERSSAILLPSLVGNIPEIDRVQTIAENNGLYFIEDSADTIGAEYRGKPTGHYTDVSTTSFYASHIVTGLGGGGMLCVDDSAVRDKALKLRGWGRSSAVDETEDIQERLSYDVDGIQYDRKFMFDERGYNFLGLEASAAACLEQLQSLETRAEKRAKNFERYRAFFAEHEEYFVLPREYDGVVTNWLAFPVRLHEDTPFDRADLVEHLEKNGIQTRSLWAGNITRHPGFSSTEFRVASDELANADLVMSSAFVIGCHQSLDDEQINHVQNTVSDFLQFY